MDQVRKAPGEALRKAIERPMPAEPFAQEGAPIRKITPALPRQLNFGMNSQIIKMIWRQNT
jgi:hypothetical protein